MARTVLFDIELYSITSNQMQDENTLSGPEAWPIEPSAGTCPKNT
jgi:hypothetical protein